MGLGRFIGRAVAGVVGLAVAAFVVLPVLVAGIPLILMAVAGVVGAALLLTVGLPALIVGLLVLIALGALISVTVGLVGFGVLLLKIALIAIVVSWLFRLFFGRTPRRHDRVLAGPPIAEVRAPLRDKYEIEAERELDRDLGL
jgi:hypothetical protein